MSLWIDSIKRANSDLVRKEDDVTIYKVMEYCYNIKESPNITIRIENGQKVVDVEGNFEFKIFSCKDGKLPFKFGKVTGSFSCYYNGLTSLEGCPKTVGAYFSCNHNNLTTLEGCPKEVGGGFYCGDNNLNTLEGCPKEVGGDFYCSDNNLTSLEGCPKVVYGNFKCHRNNSKFTLFGIGEVKGCIN